MKICMIVEDYPPRAGGGGIFVSNLSQILSSSHEITVITPAYELKDGIRKEGQTTVVRLGSKRAFFFFNALWFLLTNGRFDIYHSHGSIPGFLAKTASLLKGGKTILHVHGFRDKALIGPIKYFFQVLFTKLGHSRIISVDPVSSAKIVALGVPRDKISNVPCGVDTSKFFPIHKKAKNPKTVFLFVGRLAKVKDLPTLLASAKMAQDHGLPVEFWIAGEGEQEAELHSITRENGIENVKFLGSIPHEGVNDLYNRADFFILPSLSEGSPLVLLEAMACGLPVIISVLPSLSEISEASGAAFIFPKSDAKQLYSRIEKAVNLGGPELGAMRRNARAFAEKNHSWAAVASEIERIYSEVANAR